MAINKDYIGNPLGFFNDNAELVKAQYGIFGNKINPTKRDRRRHTKKTCSKDTWWRTKNCRKKH